MSGRRPRPVALLPAPGATGFSGALNLYSRQRDGLRDADPRCYWPTTLLWLWRVSAPPELAELRETHLRRAVTSRGVIGEAKGILMARQGISAGDAFDILRRTSPTLNTTLVEIAETLVARHQELGKPRPACDVADQTGIRSATGDLSEPPATGAKPVCASVP